MQRTPVESSNIFAIGYDPVRKVLEIEFIGKGKPGSVYEYIAVPPEIHQELMDSESKGQYFHANIRDSYEYKKLV